MLIKFEKENCVNCQKMNDIFKKYDLEPDKNIVIDDTNQQLLKQYDITILPTVLITSDEDDEYEEYDRLEGVPKLSVIKQFLDL